ncbi:hypothetical protein [Sinomonas sp. ASV322]|uniref:hypothetical protein n=1 Tax=Sinomonas sp. ASV322 TaxID=3041920 RepID=UPI0027DB2F62|nr:hypothetical protein [Sinomonas sp. ASV322]MDQ4501622.1 hypothetical protein [Sinomonas sp. ASV322]
MLKRVSAVLLGLSVLAIASCAPEHSNSAPRKLAGSFTELIEDYLSRPSSNDFEREVFERARATGRIDQADYDEAFSRYSQCMADGGKPITLRRLPNGLYWEGNVRVNAGESSEQVEALALSCAQTAKGFIPEAFGIQQENRELAGDPYEVAYRCLERSDLVRDGYSLEQFRKGFREPKVGGGSSLADMPFDFKSDEVQACLVGANMSVAVQ